MTSSCSDDRYRYLAAVASITFACGAPVGGAVASTLALAQQAVAAGHDVRLVVASGDPYERLPRLTSALVRVGRRSERLGRLAWTFHDRLSSRTTRTDGSPTIERASDVPAAVGRVHRPGALLVINSVRHLDLERLHAIARRSGSPTVWYLREAASLVTLAAGDIAPDALVANSRPLAAQAAEIVGQPCAYVPSVIDREGLTEPRQREVLLAINPIPSHGLDVLLRLAEAHPRRRLVLQESWPLDAGAVRALQTAAERLPNLELRRHAPRSEVFRDAWALLLPHDGPELGAARPRVALEAQLLGIPVIASAISGLSAAVASAELLVPDGGGMEAWSDAISRVERSYQRFSDDARAFADREVPGAEEIWAAFVAACPVDLV